MPAISPLTGDPIKRADAERLAGVLKAFAENIFHVGGPGAGPRYEAPQRATMLSPRPKVRRPSVTSPGR